MLIFAFMFLKLYVFFNVSFIYLFILMNDENENNIISV